jgi:hypothetical protein
LNNCNAGPRDYVSVMRGLNNEFDSPSIIAFYKPKVPGILDLVSDTFTLTLQTPNGGGTGFWLGQYDMSAKDFPFVNLAGASLTAPITLCSVFPADAPSGRCSSPFNVAYKVNFPAIQLTQFRMDEQAARNYVATVRNIPGRPRPIYVQVELQILPTAPEVSMPHSVPMNMAQCDLMLGRSEPGQRQVVTFSGKVKKITAITTVGNQELGQLYP